MMYRNRKTRGLRLVLLGLAGCLAAALTACAGKKPAEADTPGAAPASDFVCEFLQEGGNAVIKKYVGNEKTVVIPQTIDGMTVRLISDGAFSGSEVEKVVIPSTVTHIYYYSFNSCPALREVEFGDGVLEIMEWAFKDCPALTAVTLPATLRNLGTEAFACDPRIYEDGGIREAHFRGDAPSSGLNPFGESEAVKVYYPKDAAGWNDTRLREMYALVEE